MNGLKRFLRFLAAFAAVLAAAGIILELIHRHNDKMDELDAYLTGDEDEDDIPQAALGDDEYMEQDLEEWDSLAADQKVEISFLISPDHVDAFQEILAKDGYSSNYDQESGVLDILISGPRDHQEIVDLENLLKSALKEADGTYLGFAFE